MSERKRSLDVDKEDSDSDPVAKRPPNSEDSMKQELIDYSNDYSPRSPSPLRSPSNAQFSPCSQSPPSSPPKPVTKTETIKKSSVEVPERFLERVRERIDVLQKETSCIVNISPRITGLTRTVFLQGLHENILIAKDRIEQIVMTSIGFIHQIARKHLQPGDEDYLPPSSSPVKEEIPIKKRVTIDIPASKFQCYLVVGKFGATVKKMEMDTRCQIFVHKETESIEISGFEEDVEKASKLMTEIFAASSALSRTPEKPITENASVIREINIPAHLSYGFIMPQKAKDLCLQSGVRWQFQHIEKSQNVKLMRLLGKEEEVKKVMKEVEECMDNLWEDKMFILSSKVAKVIGKNGEIIKSLSEKSGAECHFNQKDPLSSLQTLIIKGPRKAVETAKQMIQELIDATVFYLHIPFQVYSAVIGNENENIINISEVSGAQCTCCIDSSGDQKKKVIKVQGPEEQVELAVSLLKCSIEIEKAKIMMVETVKMSAWKAGFAIGKNGSTSAFIRKESGAECVWKMEENGVKSLEISGTSEQVEHAKRLIRHQIEEKRVAHCLDIPFHLYSTVVGDNNQKATEISGVSGAKCTCCPNQLEDQRQKYIRIEGTVEQVEQAIFLFKASIEAEETKTTVSYVNVPASKCGLVIGKRHENLISIRNESGADCILSEETGQHRIFEIRGTTEQIAHATGLIEKVIEDKQQLSYTMFVPVKSVGRVIGINGVTIDSICVESGAEITYDPRRLAEPMKKFNISGTTHQIEKAKTLIQEASGVVIFDPSPNMDYHWNGYAPEMFPPPPPPPPPLPRLRLTPPPPPPSPRRSLLPSPPITQPSFLLNVPPFDPCYPGPSHPYSYSQHSHPPFGPFSYFPPR